MTNHVDVDALTGAANYLAGRYGEHDGWATAIRNAIAALSAQQSEAVARCKKCKGRGYTDEGDPEVGSALFDCDECTSPSPTPAMRAVVEALKACAAVCAGEVTNKNGLINALEQARSALSHPEVAKMLGDSK